MKYDPVTERIHELLGKIPRVGSQLARVYYWRPMMFNFMLVGASGTLLSYGLYEGIFRPALSPLFGGAFLGMVITTILVFLWNFTWNKRWSLNSRAQILKMDKKELRATRDLINEQLED
jgi:hypothetical protein